MNTAAPPPTRSDATGVLQEPRSRRGTPVWETAYLFHCQGEWTPGGVTAGFAAAGAN